MGQPFTQPKAEHRGSAWVITRTQDPDDEFAEHVVLCHDDFDAVDYVDPSNYGLRWRPVGSSYDGNAVVFASEYEAVRAIVLMLFGRDSVSVGFSL